MSTTPIQVLLVEDSPTDADLLQRVIERSNGSLWQIAHVERLRDGISACGDRQFDIALLDLCLPDAHGLETVTQFRTAIPDTPVVVLTVLDREDLALQAVEEGAQDYLVKDRITLQQLERTLHHAIVRGKMLQQRSESERNCRLALEQEQEINQLKSSFFSMISHEFRNPLTTIRSSAEIIQDYHYKLPPERRSQHFQRIYNSISQMLQLLDRLLLLKQNQISIFQYQPAPLDLASFCQELIEALTLNSVHHNRLNFICQGECIRAVVDANLLYHILTNLISNALKYSPADSCVQFSLICLDGKATFQIQDRGIGIPEKDKQRLFAAFHRCGNVGGIPGTGIGLAIVKQCVELHQGEIQVESEEGEGTTFTVTLPME
ncbi:MAG: Adaptive-response sensory-kinase SasA [Chroococcidiopsis cubana SAG 39.79]|jgi:signal transduction histidine kinase|uniref:histidine kinase n=1 Tax=Chroococcidiopsis cubana SAG 39.79 TaxID=388085 RepID=A0AB37UL57_9CYAN|nr:hybrid sensor histidine kinase/response regulator [Chroococcidiopsis cubana]MDZ4872670.1 Adaptive-response sensory-kinase SasA [Chroococcidiopsis cubana SAG 39.79]PSB43816.1 hybrid sensor histidine kinase/response regulator [Cyanosarcina cf. burmensis CCALA 770]PSB60718.1 hybrid sensor histidine kinase/response regulator [Chroococcidiopsis cubana CCALA 043]RUT12116.1 hypothetical protein DSM107010_25310 [Chroococcidiopsis cubana SAG 39.79]